MNEPRVCAIEENEAEWLVEALHADGSAPALEAAAAIRWSTDGHLAVHALEPELRAAILGVLDDSAPGLVDLRSALFSTAERQPIRRRILTAVHNPMGRTCQCLSDCWCRRTAWGRVMRWYVPARRHTSVSPCWECVTRQK